MANLADSIVFGDLTVTRDQLVKGTLTVEGLLELTGNVNIGNNLTVGGTVSGNGSGLTSLNANNLSSGTVPTARLPAAALIGDTTYSAGTGLSMSGTTINVSNPFNPSGTYSGLRAQGTLKGDVGLGNVPNIDMRNASNLSSGTVPTARLPSAALIGDTTYTAGTGLSMSGTTININTPFNTSGDYGSLRARATTKSDVGLGSVDNYSRAYYDGRYLLSGAKAADSNLLDGIDSSGFLRANATDVASGRITFSNGAGVEIPRGITGGYGDTAGTGSNWGASIWGMGDAYNGSGNGTSHSPGSYEIAWLRASHADANGNVGEGLYVFSQGGYRGGIGSAGGQLTGDLRVNGTITGNGSGISALNASNLNAGTVATARLPSAALIGDTTYSAGTGLSLSGTTFNISNPFNPSGSYSGLRAQNTTKGDVGLGSVRNVASYSQGESDGRYLRSNTSDTMSGNLTVTGEITATDVTITSDLRVKSNLEPIASPLEKILKLTGFTYQMKGLKPSDRRMGLVAQDVLEQFPEAVHGTEDTHYSLSYGSLVAALVNGMKEQQEQIAQMQQRLETLES
jgi:hypothetical protein